MKSSIASPASITIPVRMHMVRTPIARAIGIVNGAATNEIMSDDGRNARPACNAS